MNRILVPGFALAASLAASPAMAHLAPEEHGSFAAGFTHPLFGIDHILAMLAVGLWAAMIGGRAVWSLPAAFMGVMTVGFLLAMAGLPLPFVEPAILASVIVLGVLVALAARLPLPAAGAIAAAFGAFHGHAHGAEIGAATMLPYLGGFALATVLLHAVGVAAGLALGRFGQSRLARTVGGAVALLGGALVLGA